MGSRIRESPEHLFEVFTEVARPGQPQDKAFVLQKFPDEFTDQKALESEVPKFAFPGETESSAVDHFSFTLTDEESKLRFGFCRHAAGSQTCLCIVSFLPWFEIFYRLLNHLAEILNQNEANSVVPVLEALYKLPIPKPGDSVEIPSNGVAEKFCFVCPNLSELPSIPENRNLTEYYNAVDLSTMISVFASMLQERRILITSRKLSRLTSCIHGAASLLYPMYWQHIYIPVLPPHLIDYCSAPMPYLIGIHSSLFKKLRAPEVGDAVVIDADNNTIVSDYNDLDMLPAEVLSALKKKLKAHTADKSAIAALGDGVTRAFMSANVALIGGYRQALRFPPGERITFDEDAFIHSRPPYMQPFLQKMLNTQIFEQFINERLDKLIAGEGFSDEFDNEVNMEQDKWATQSRYKEWYGNVRKHGKKFRRDGRDKWVEFSSKVRDKSKRAVKDLRAKIDDLKKPPRPPPMDHSLVLGSPAHTGSIKHSVNRTASYEKARQYKIIALDDLHIEDPGPAPRTRPRSPPTPLSPAYRSSRSLLRHSRHSRRLASEDTDIIADMTFQRVSLDLLGDQDIQSMLKKSYSLEDLAACEEDDSEYAGDDSEEWDDVDEEEDDREIGYKELTSPAVDAEKSETSTNNGVDALINLDDNSPVSTLARDVNANLPSQDPTLVNKFPSAGSLASSESAKSTEEQNTPKSFLYSRATASRTKLDQPSTDQHTPVVPKRRPRRGSAVKNALGKPTYNVDADQSAPSSNNSSPRLGFEDNFVAEVHAPPVPPKVPLKSTPSFSRDRVTSTCSPQSNKVLATDPDVTPAAHPVPMRRTSINRKPAFYNEQRPQSFRKSSSGPQLGKDAQTIKDARTAFIKAEGKKPVIHKRDELDQFDPLITGQLAIDNPGEDPSKSKDKEEDLLKEWDLDFHTRKSTHAGPPVPPKPNSPKGTIPALYSSSPVLNCYPGNLNAPFNISPIHRSAGPRYPLTQPNRWGQPVPRTAQWGSSTGPSVRPGSQLQTQHQSVQSLIQQFTPPSQPGGRPVSQVVIRDKSSELALLAQRPTSVYVEGTQDPFSPAQVHHKGVGMSNGAASQNQSAAGSKQGVVLPSGVMATTTRSWEKFD